MQGLMCIGGYHHGKMVPFNQVGSVYKYYERNDGVITERTYYKSQCNFDTSATVAYLRFEGISNEDANRMFIVELMDAAAAMQKVIATL